MRSMSSLSRFSKEIGHGVNFISRSSDISEENKNPKEAKAISKKKKKTLHGVALGFGA